MREWFGPLVQGPAKHVWRLARDPEYRTLCRLDAQLGGRPRYRECRARVHGFDLSIPDAASFLSSFREIFVERSLAFPWGGEAPRILDLGANIGLSVLAFKRTFPRARITALEPDPRLFEFLKRNVCGNGFTDVTLLEKAAWREPARLRFLSDGADGGRALAPDAEIAQGAPAIEVDAIDLSALLLAQPFDFVKMDIEGAERAVLPTVIGALDKVTYIFVEYHGSSKEPSSLAPVIVSLESAGFRVRVQTVRSPRQPFLSDTPDGGYDLILHLYGTRA